MSLRINCSGLVDVQYLDTRSPIVLSRAGSFNTSTANTVSKLGSVCTSDVMLRRNLYARS